MTEEFIFMTKKEIYLDYHRSLAKVWEPVDEKALREQWSMFAKSEAEKHIKNAHFWRLTLWQQAIRRITR